MEQFDDGTQFSIREHAAEWFLRLHAHDLSVAERFAYLQWLKASPAHIGETLQICKLYSLLYPMQKQLFFTNEDDVSNVIELPREDSAGQPSRTRSSWHIHALIVALAIGGVLLAGSIVKRTWLDPTIETQASEWRSLPLNDGSLVSVGPHTRLRSQFGEHQRLLRLARGEALFEVTQDTSRPFVVDAELAVVRATGTRFGVSRRDLEVVITVEEGTVLVSRDRDQSNAVEVEGGEQTIVTGTWPPAVRRVNAVRALAWSNRRLIFDNDSVAVAVEEFNRRNRVQLVVDPALSTQRVFGEFYADDPGSFAESIANTRKGLVVHQSRDVILLQPVAQPR
ncbi:MAG TPA: FecR domain-containing protein [Steroidobacteraceae bacterium]|jgi:transmembrane sensor|nr:FecR domain-containing protein [Steroidobacteraceae bacterium]